MQNIDTTDHESLNQKPKKDKRLEIQARDRKISVSTIIGCIFVLLIAIFVARVAIWEKDYLDRMEGSPRAGSDTTYIEGDEYDTVEPTIEEIEEYRVAANRPRYLSIPSLSISNARIMEVSVLSSGALATPYNIYDIGWWNESGLPGSNQVSVMDGHGGGVGIGIFGNLPLIEQGAEIIVEMGNGDKFTYEVYDTATHQNGSEANAYMSTLESSPEAGRGSLSLITCTGEWSQRERTYSHRFFLRALLRD